MAVLAELEVQAAVALVLLEQQAQVLAARQHQVRVALVGVQLQLYRAVAVAGVQARVGVARVLGTAQTVAMALRHL
jgi:hypothetical protein